MLEIGIGICLKKANKNERIHESVAERMQKNNDELKSVKVDVVTKFVRDEVENSIDNAHDYWIQIKHS